MKTGGTLKTAVGVLAIQRVEKTSDQQISQSEVRQAGYSGKDALLNDLGSLAYAGEDPRIRLREDDTVTETEFTEVRERLQRLDSASRAGDWTLRILRAIRDDPRLPAAKLAVETGFEKAWLKRNVRKLKNLGLTMSHHPGYTLSPRGEAVLERLTSRP